MEKKYGHIMDLSFFFSLSKVAGLSLLSITWRAKKKEVYIIVFHGFKEKYFLLCFHSNISWNIYDISYELAFLV